MQARRAAAAACRIGRHVRPQANTEWALGVRVAALRARVSPHGGGWAVRGELLTSTGRDVRAARHRSGGRQRGDDCGCHMRELIEAVKI